MQLLNEIIKLIAGLVLVPRAALLGLLLLCPRPSAAQNVVAKLGGYEEYVAGALGNAILRAPIINPSWRKPWVRATVFFGASTIYETLIDPAAAPTCNCGHNGWKDWSERALGYVVIEVAIWGVRKLHRHGSSPSPNELFGHDHPGSAISPEKLERH